MIVMLASPKSTVAHINHFGKIGQEETIKSFQGMAGHPL